MKLVYPKPSHRMGKRKTLQIVSELLKATKVPIEGHGKSLFHKRKVSNMSKRLNIMAKWKEFNPLAEKSMKEDFSNSPSPNSKKIIAYLNNGEITLVSPSSAVDCFSGERINQTNCILTDGEYSWSNSLGYYIIKYNLQIPKEFEDKIIEA